MSKICLIFSILPKAMSISRIYSFRSSLGEPWTNRQSPSSTRVGSDSRNRQRAFFRPDRQRAGLQHAARVIHRFLGERVEALGARQHCIVMVARKAEAAHLLDEVNAFLRARAVPDDVSQAEDFLHALVAMSASTACSASVLLWTSLMMARISSPALYRLAARIAACNPSLRIREHPSRARGARIGVAANLDKPGFSLSGARSASILAVAGSRESSVRTCSSESRSSKHRAYHAPSEWHCSSRPNGLSKDCFWPRAAIDCSPFEAAPGRSGNSIKSAAVRARGR